MRRHCTAHRCVSVAAVLAWVVVGYLVWAQPAPDATARLPFMVVTGVAVGLSSLSLFPLVMRDYLADVVLAYMAGYHQRDADEETGKRPRLEVLQGGR